MSTPAWGLAQYIHPTSTVTTTGILLDGVLRAAPAGLAATPVIDILDEWHAYEPRLRALDPAAGAPIVGARIVAPITYPRKVLCAGANYYAHAEEMGTTRPSPYSRPFFFLKPPTTTIVGPDAGVAYPSGGDAALDWEAELAVVISARARHVTPEQARRYIAGYAAANDLSARGSFARPDAVMAPFVYDWLGHKAQDGFCPFGPALVPAWLVPDPQDLTIGLSVNGVIKQRSSTSDMVVGVLELVSAASRFLTLEPGDLVLTGTPAGVGLPRGDFLHPGDVVTVHIGGIGDLTTTIGPPEAPASPVDDVARASTTS